MQRACCVLAALLAAPAALLADRVQYCTTDTYSGNASYMHFNKELIVAEYAVQNQFKAIHCCGKGYRSIEWFKNGAAYPWASGVSNLILYPEAANQTLYTQRAGRIDSGNYTCRMRNDTHHLDHTVPLLVTEIAPDSPRATVTPNDKTVAIGDEARFYCEAFVGRVDLADAHNDIRWRRVRPEQAEPLQAEFVNFEQRLTERKNEYIKGALLVIRSVRPEDYGQYVCTVRSNDVVREMPATLHLLGGSVDDGYQSVPWRSLLLCSLLGGATLLSAVVLYARCWPRLVLAARLLHARRAPSAHLSDKEYDVLVVCTAVDAELTRGALLPTLALKYHYRTAHVQLTTHPDTWYWQVSERARACRSLVCVLSPAQHSPAQLLTALKQLRALPVPPVIVLLQDLPKLKREAKDESGDSLVSLLRRTKLLPWRHVQDRAFWTALRLALPLPPPRRAHLASPVLAPSADQRDESSVNMVELARGSGHGARHAAARSDSLDALV